MFYYTFWPYAYEPSYWAHAYDDFFDGVFFPDDAVKLVRPPLKKFYESKR